MVTVEGVDLEELLEGLAGVPISVKSAIIFTFFNSNCTLIFGSGLEVQALYQYT